MEHIDWHAERWIEGTWSMSLELRGAYDTLINHCYDRANALPNDARYIAGLFGCSIRKTRVLVRQLLALGKIVETDDGRLLPNRCRLEIERAAARIQQRRDARAQRTRNQQNQQANAYGRSNGECPPETHDDPPVYDTEIQQDQPVSSYGRNGAGNGQNDPENAEPPKNDVAKLWFRGGDLNENNDLPPYNDKDNIKKENLIKERNARSRDSPKGNGHDRDEWIDPPVKRRRCPAHDIIALRAKGLLP